MKKIKCKCPKCEKTFQKRLFLYKPSNGLFRMYCPECRKALNVASDSYGNIKDIMKNYKSDWVPFSHTPIFGR